MIEFLAGAATALLVLAVLNRRIAWEFITEECRYRRDGIRVWWILRQERAAEGSEK
jgi:hypothetical protein